MARGSAMREQVALVTGASSGVGRAIALALAHEGAQLALAGRNERALGEVVGLCARASPRVERYIADFRDGAQVEGLAGAVLRDFGRVDVLVHSAGVIVSESFAAATPADFAYQHQVNVAAPFALTQALLPSLAAHQGQVVFINSSAGKTAGAGASQYAATKHALRAIADGLRAEVNARGIRVLSLYLGRTASPMQAAVHAAERREYHPERLIQPEDVAQLLVGVLALPRTVEVTDISLRPMLKPL